MSKDAEDASEGAQAGGEGSPREIVASRDPFTACFGKDWRGERRSASRQIGDDECTSRPVICAMQPRVRRARFYAVRHLPRSSGKNEVRACGRYSSLAIFGQVAFGCNANVNRMKIVRIKEISNVRRVSVFQG